MKIIHNIYAIDKTIGGPIFSMKLIAEAQAAMGHEVTVVSGQSLGHDRPISFDTNVKLILIPSYTKYRYMFNWSSIVKKEIGIPDVIHTYGVWTYHNLAAYGFSIKYNIAHIVAPCGMLYKEARTKSSIIKNIVWKTYQKNILKSTKCFHAKSSQESNSLLSLFPDNKVQVIPNPLVLDDRDNGDKNNFSFIDNYIADKRVLLYIGRLVKRKGIEDLINVWDQNALSFPDWCVVIVGDDEKKGYLKTMLDQLEKCKNINYIDFENKKSKKSNPNLIITGSLYGKQKDAIFKRASIFINPSNFENFGMTIAEAFSYSLPAIISKNTPWTKVEDKKCGWFLNENNKNLDIVFKTALALDAHHLKKMGRNGLQVVKHLKKDNIAKQIIMLYEKYR